MKDSAKDPLFTVNGVLLWTIYAVVCASILFSLDPEWVAWAAPLGFGGSLYASDPPAASAQLGLSRDLLPWAYLYGCVALLAITLFDLVHSRQRFKWLSGLKAECEHGSVARLRTFLKSCLTFTFSR
ncbi:MAG: hypothetical protein WCB94_08570 [Terriglobales bacterium]